MISLKRYMRVREVIKKPWNNLTAELRLSCFFFIVSKIFFVWLKNNHKVQLFHI